MLRRRTKQNFKHSELPKQPWLPWVYAAGLYSHEKIVVSHQGFPLKFEHAWPQSPVRLINVNTTIQRSQTAPELTWKAGLGHSSWLWSAWGVETIVPKQESGLLFTSSTRKVLKYGNRQESCHWRLQSKGRVMKRTPVIMDVFYTDAATCFFFFVGGFAKQIGAYHHFLHWYICVGRCAWRGEEGAVTLGPVTKHFCKTLSCPAPTVSTITSAPRCVRQICCATGEPNRLLLPHNLRFICYSG